VILVFTVIVVNRKNLDHTKKHLILNTNSLEPTIRAAVEFIAEDATAKSNRQILKYRHLFTVELTDSTQHMRESVTTVGPSIYREDEAGNEISENDFFGILSGNPNAMVIPHGFEDHDVELMFSNRKPLPLAQGILSQNEVRLLGIFQRDIQELQESNFFINAPGTLTTVGVTRLSPAQSMKLATPCNDEEIRSYVTIFRRLYMTSSRDPANLSLIVPIAGRALGDHPYGIWLEKTFESYSNHLKSKQKIWPFGPLFECTFTTRELIDVFLYSQYSHQPDLKKEQEFDSYIDEMTGNRDLLTWLFLTEIHHLGRKMKSISTGILPWFCHYCAHNNCKPSVLDSIHKVIPGIGAQEKQEDRRKRLIEEKAKELAFRFWSDAGEPNGGPELFLDAARKKIEE
jgi:hypothetical protein